MSMQLQTLQKGALYTADCAKCGAVIYSHEWATDDHNERRDAMENGTLHCPEGCGGRADPKTFYYVGRQYACRYSMPGFLDCTEWNFGRNRRTLERETRAMYYGD